MVCYFVIYLPTLFLSNYFFFHVICCDNVTKIKVNRKCHGILHAGLIRTQVTFIPFFYLFCCLLGGSCYCYCFSSRCCCCCFVVTPYCLLCLSCFSFLTEDGEFPGLIPLIECYLSNMDVDVDTHCTISQYLKLISRRASGEW